MEIKENTLVILNWRERDVLGLVTKKIPAHGCVVNNSFVVKLPDGITSIFPEEKLIPIAQTNGVINYPGDALRAQLSDVIVILTRMIVELQHQVRLIQSNVDGVLGVGLKRTQEHLREHELRPH